MPRFLFHRSPVSIPLSPRWQLIFLNGKEKKKKVPSPPQAERGPNGKCRALKKVPAISPNPRRPRCNGMSFIQHDLSLRDCARGVIEDPFCRSRAHCQGDVPFNASVGEDRPRAAAMLCLLSCPTGSWQGFSRSQLLRAGPKQTQAGHRYGERYAGGARGWGPLFARPISEDLFFGVRREKSNTRRGFILRAARTNAARCLGGKGSRHGTGTSWQPPPLAADTGLVSQPRLSSSNPGLEAWGKPR